MGNLDTEGAPGGQPPLRWQLGETDFQQRKVSNQRETTFSAIMSVFYAMAEQEYD